MRQEGSGGTFGASSSYFCGAWGRSEEVPLPRLVERPVADRTAAAGASQDARDAAKGLCAQVEVVVVCEARSSVVRAGREMRLLRRDFGWQVIGGGRSAGRHVGENSAGCRGRCGRANVSEVVVGRAVAAYIHSASGSAPFVLSESTTSA